MSRALRCRGADRWRTHPYEQHLRQIQPPAVRAQSIHSALTLTPRASWRMDDTRQGRGRRPTISLWTDRNLPVRPSGAPGGLTR